MLSCCGHTIAVTIAVADDRSENLLQLVHCVSCDWDSDSVGLWDGGSRDSDRRSDEGEDGGGTHGEVFER